MTRALVVTRRPADGSISPVPDGWSWGQHFQQGRLALLYVDAPVGELQAWCRRSVYRRWTHYPVHQRDPSFRRLMQGPGRDLMRPHLAAARAFRLGRVLALPFLAAVLGRQDLALATLFVENFNYGSTRNLNGTSLDSPSGATWWAEGTLSEQAGGFLYTSANRLCYVAGETTTDVTAAKTTVGSVGVRVGTYLHSAGATFAAFSGYRLGMGGAGALFIERWDAGAKTTLATQATTNPAVGENVTITANAAGAMSATHDSDGSGGAAATDTNYTTWSFGCWCYQSYADYWEADVVAAGAGSGDMPGRVGAWRGFAR